MPPYEKNAGEMAAVRGRSTELGGHSIWYCDHKETKNPLCVNAARLDKQVLSDKEGHQLNYKTIWLKKPLVKFWF